MEKKSPDKPADLTVRILEQIRDQVTATNGRLDTLRTELTERIDALQQRQTEDSVRVATEIVALRTTFKDMRDLLRDRRAERAVLGDHEKRIRALERKSA